MYLKIQKLSPELISKAEKYFGKDFCVNLKTKKPGTYNESLIARYLLFPHLDKKGVRGWSISHKKDLVFIGTNKTKIGVDIELFKKRDESLLNNFSEIEYEILGGKNWNNFYILWTAKEAIIKFENLVLDNIENIKLLSQRKINKNISGINFINEFTFTYENKKFYVLNSLKDDLVFSICF